MIGREAPRGKGLNRDVGRGKVICGGKNRRAVKVPKGKGLSDD